MMKLVPHILLETCERCDDIMKVHNLSQLTEEERQDLLRRSEIDISSYASSALEIIDSVKKDGDKALVYYTQKFDKVALEQNLLKVFEEEIENAHAEVDDNTLKAIEYAAANIKKFHREQLPPQMWMKEIDNGVLAGEKITPISDVCLYIPRGKGSFPSVMLMLGIPAVLAGVPRIIVTTPPGEGGKVDPATLAAAHIAGVREIYKVGGAQAVAAAAYGTETIPKCRKLTGPGNVYVNAAKRMLYGVLDVGLPAGPSEAIILADENTDPYLASLDLLIEAEHGPDSASLLVTHSPALAEKVTANVEKLLPQLPDQKRDFVEKVLNSYGGIVLTENLEDSLNFVNEYAPEHLEVLIEDPFSLLPQIFNAGEILLGPNTPITLCNFVLGPNAILPTGSFAKTFSGVSVHDFLKRSSFAHVTSKGLSRAGKAAAQFARTEGFSAHAAAVERRMEKGGNDFAD